MKKKHRKSLLELVRCLKDGYIDLEEATGKGLGRA